MAGNESTVSLFQYGMRLNGGPYFRRAAGYEPRASPASRAAGERG